MQSGMQSYPQSGRQSARHLLKPKEKRQPCRRSPWTCGHLHVVVARFLTTILPGSGRPTGCLPGSLCRHSLGRDVAYNCSNIDANIEPNNVANNYRSNDSYDFVNNARYSDG
jgi:hypothetical protein